MALIDVDHLAKSFWTSKRRDGRLGVVTAVLSRDVREVRAVDGITFSIDAGEMVWCIGPNGAGKSTATDLIAAVAARYRVQDISIEEAAIEEIIRGIYENGLSSLLE